MVEITFIKVFVDYLDAIEPLGDAERGRLFTSLLQYARTGEVPQLGGNERFLFPMMRAQIDRDIAEYISLVERKSEAGKKGGRPKKAEKASAFSEKQKKQMLFLESEKSKDIRHKTEDKDKDKDKDKDIRHKTEDKDNSARTRDADAFAAFAAGDVELMSVLKDFEKMRKSIKKPLTDTAKKLLVSKLKNNFPPEQWKAVLEQSIVKCWQDVYPLKEQEQQRQGVVQHTEMHTPDQLEQLKAVYAKVKGEQT